MSLTTKLFSNCHQRKNIGATVIARRLRADDLFEKAQG